MTTVLRTQNLTKRYNGLTAVDGLTLEVREGEIFGLLGPNGAGKTTSIHMMCGLLAPDAGEVFIDGRLVHGRDVDVRARVGVCPQQVILWEKLTCIEQLEFVGEMYNVPQKTARQRGDELLDTLGLLEKRDQLAATLSGGMQRRLNLALALVHDPQILVLDEPEAGLDPQSRILVREYIRSLARQKTIILTTHNMDEADRMADRVAIIDRGALLALDTPEALKRTVGEGDVLELAITGLPPTRAVGALQPIVRDATARKDSLTLRARNIVDKLPAIIETVKNAGGQIGEVRLRANTLEDVFISL
ncbi:MAG: ABC transporter ATP-binding protein, partial [Gammaproteobacteria bacterium]|nr:ABC transporter ATP-binding protein [Gammaproteobacteria bacterium]